MKIRRILQAALGLSLIFSVIIISGCILDPKETTDEQVNEEPWPDRTEKGDCIDIIVRAYQEKDIERYKELLLEEDQSQDPEFSAGYIWFNQPTDQEQYGVSLSYVEDWSGTQWIFDNAGGKLNIDLYSDNSQDSWTEETDLGENIFSKKVRYTFDFNLPDPDSNEGGFKNFRGDAYVEFFIGPDPDDTEKYLIYRAHDLPN
ncbi:MAG TPA: hypothetical protein VKO43_00815 [Candidatus Krumholzibacteriaceae bacterium]|nr:hypothetical protein [Candidatus Krumholzibacteriaceae bacterium]